MFWNSKFLIWHVPVPNSRCSFWILNTKSNSKPIYAEYSRDNIAVKQDAIHTSFAWQGILFETPELYNLSMLMFPTAVLMLKQYTAHDLGTVQTCNLLLAIDEYFYSKFIVSTHMVWSRHTDWAGGEITYELVIN